MKAFFKHSKPMNTLETINQRISANRFDPAQPLSRAEIEELVGTKVYLELWVKVWERWRRRDNLLRQLGYAVERKKAT